MDKLDSELQRLHFLPVDQRQALGIRFLRATDWPAIATLCQAMQEELDLPTPVVSIDGQGYQLWLSLAEAVDAGQATSFLDSLCARHLADIPESRLQFGLPDNRPPAPLADGERWAAFIDPGMGSMFTREPWLDMPPNRNQQSDLLAGCKSVNTTDFRRALALLQPAPERDAGKAPEPLATLSIPGEFTDPRQFLLAVMNNPQARLEQRIDAAKALLPYCENLGQPSR